MNDPFYENGLQFECCRCSQCCRHDPGYVFLSKNDLKRILAYTSLPQQDFIDRYCITVPMNGVKRLSLKETKDFDCIFWSTDGCKVYEARPLQCRSYPFWKVFLVDNNSWDSLTNSCPGINKGKTYRKKEIEKWLLISRNEQFIVII